MSDILIKHAVTGKTIYQGRFDTVRNCVEAAVAENIDLSDADLRRANLSNASLDNARMQNVRLDEANLAGANMSEALLDGSVFANAGLQNACLCDSSLTNCDFTGTQFGATDIAGARIDGARFSTLSAFSLNFRDAESLMECRFMNELSLQECPFSRPPLALWGLAHTVAIMDRHIQIGPVTLKFEDWFAARPDALRLHGPVYSFLTAMRRPLTELILRHGVPAPLRAAASGT